MFKNPEQIFSIEMILMDEEGTKIHANVLQKWVAKFKILLHEGAVIFIKNPTIAEHVSKGLKLHVTLWDAFAEQFNEYVSIHKDEGLVVVVIQFAVVKIYREKPSLSNSFNGTRLFINSEIDEIKDFRNSLLGLSGESKSSQQLTMLSGLSYSYREDFLDNNSKANIAEISEVVEAKSLIILGTVKAFSKDIPWFYMGCKRCSRKVRPTYIITDKNDGSGQVEETEKFECDSDKCKGQDTDVLPKKFAIKIEVNNYNIKNSCFVYGISKLTDDENILNELEMRFSAQRPAESDSVNVLSPDFGYVEKLKDAVSFTGENATPSNVDKSTADSPVSQEKAYQKKICKSVDLKRDFYEIYDADDAMKGSATKSSKTCIPIEKE
ncbi:hypothetical protein L6452_35040 [Arctium lappa]|uniref:Uncharacterized protein n=1 Tax=Arctium lappa TaxID=4217 RepID=A0ACB8YKI9_ARCLA|nr:hypothetical protein L6452_35040 [Arctium lappa]